MANIGFATLSIIPSFEGLQQRLRVGIAVPLGKIGKDAGRDAGRDFGRELERGFDPDLRRAGRDAGSDFAKSIESSARPDFTPAGRDAGRDFARAAQSAGGPDFSSQGREAGRDFVRAAEAVSPPDFSSHGDDAGDSFADGLGSSIGGSAKAGLAGAGLAAAGVLSKAFFEGLDKEAVSDRLIAQLGAGHPQAQAAGRAAGELYTEGFGENREEAAAAVRGLLQLPGLVVEPESWGDPAILLEELGAAALTLSDVMEQDLLGVLASASTLVQTGLARNAHEAFDLLTRGIQLGADKGQDLLDTFTEYPTNFRKLGLSGRDAMGLIIQGLEGGARNSDVLADALLEFGVLGQEASEKTADAFRDLGLDAEASIRGIASGGESARTVLGQVLTGLRDMEDPVERNRVAVELFGTKAEDLGDALFNMDLPSATQKLGEHLGATDDLSSAYDNAQSEVETFKREAMEDLTVFLAEEAIPAVKGIAGAADEVNDAFFGAATRGIATFIDWLNQIPVIDDAGDLVGKFLGIGAGDPNDPDHQAVIDSFERERSGGSTGKFGRRLGSGSFRAGGGSIYGPGGIDNVPLWGTAGEFMMQKKAVDFYGLDFMHALNAQQLADGGPVLHKAPDGNWYEGDPFQINATHDPNAGRAGYVQAEDGSWVPSSFYSALAGGSVNRGGGFGADDWYPDPGEHWIWNGSKWVLDSTGIGPATARPPDGRTLVWADGGWQDRPASPAMQNVLDNGWRGMAAGGWQKTIAPRIRGDFGPTPWNVPTDQLRTISAGDQVALHVTQYPGEDQVSAGMRALRKHMILKSMVNAR